MAEDVTENRPRRPIGPRVVLVLAFVVVVTAAAFVLTPVPGSLVVRKVFERDARE